MVGDIDQEIEVVQKVALRMACWTSATRKTHQKVRLNKVESVGLGTKCRDAGVVDCLQRVTCRGRGTR